MQLGKLNRRITLRKPVEGVLDDLGSPTIDFVDVSTIWAAVENIPVDVTSFAGGEVAQRQIKVSIRWSVASAQVMPSWRVTYEGGEFDIKSVAEIGFRQGIELVAVAARQQAVLG